MVKSPSYGNGADPRRQHAFCQHAGLLEVGKVWALKLCNKLGFVFVDAVEPESVPVHDRNRKWNTTWSWSCDRGLYSDLTERLFRNIRGVFRAEVS